MARKHEELEVWQLADAVRKQTIQITRGAGMRREYRQRSEMEATASSICRNVAEGFRRGKNREFARFVEYSYSSCAELKSLLEDLEIQGVATGAELRPVKRLRYRLDRALVAFLRHLRRYPDRGRHDHE